MKEGERKRGRRKEKNEGRKAHFRLRYAYTAVTHERRGQRSLKAIPRISLSALYLRPFLIRGAFLGADCHLNIQRVRRRSARAEDSFIDIYIHIEIL